MNARRSARSSFHVTEILKVPCEEVSRTTRRLQRSLAVSLRCFFCPYKRVYGAFDDDVVVQTFKACSDTYSNYDA